MAKRMHNINLLPNHKDTVLIQFLNWALSIGRLLVILVETLALGTFLYRFTIDYQIVDLKDEVRHQRAIVASYQTQETMFRNFKARLELLKKYDGASGTSPKILNDIIEMGKGYVTFRSINITPAGIRIEAKAPTLAPLAVFVNSLKAYPLLTTVNLDKVENKTSSAEVIIGISADLKRDKSLEEPSEEQPVTGEAFIEQPVQE